jgi:hypothetical protein
MFQVISKYWEYSNEQDRNLGSLKAYILIGDDRQKVDKMYTLGIDKQ